MGKLNVEGAPGGIMGWMGLGGKLDLFFPALQYNCSPILGTAASPLNMLAITFIETLQRCHLAFL